MEWNVETDTGAGDAVTALLRCVHLGDQLKAAIDDLFNQSLAVVDEQTAKAFISRSKVLSRRGEELKSQLAAARRLQVQTQEQR